MSPAAFDIDALAAKYANQSPQDILREATKRFDNIAISFSGAEDVVLVDMAMEMGLPIKVFSLDTGRLHPETHQFVEKVRTYYGIEIEILFPEAQAVQNLTRTKGLYSFLEDGHKECCSIRKVEPLRRKLAALDAWVTGQRRDQSPGTRTEVPVAQLDRAFSGADHWLVKFNPLANWSSARVWDYIRGNNVPYNSLHEKGFISIGCEPCTRAVLPSQHEREGRWWWEDATDKECGLHAAANVKLAANQ